MAREATEETYIDQVYNAIYQKIIDGTFRPGEKLHIAKLSEMFGVGLSPVREALSKLTATHLVIALSQRGFIVAPVSPEDFLDIMRTRSYIDQIGLTLSMENGDESWEAHLLACFHRLDKIEKSTDIMKDLEGYKIWSKYHRHFHYALISACGLPPLIDIHNQLYQQAERYRCFLFKKYGASPKMSLDLSESVKREITEEAVKHTKRATALLVGHFEHAIKLIIETLETEYK